MALDRYFETASIGWVFNSRYSSLIGPKVVLNPKGFVSASGVKLRIREGTGDKAQRTKVTRSPGFVTEISGDTNVPAKIREIQIFGPVSRKAADPTQGVEASETDEEATSMPEDLLLDGLLN
jgi:hypothetical protein